MSPLRLLVIILVALAFGAFLGWRITDVGHKAHAHAMDLKVDSLNADSDSLRFVIRSLVVTDSVLGDGRDSTIATFTTPQEKTRDARLHFDTAGFRAVVDSTFPE